MSATYFSSAERFSCGEIIRNHNYTITPECHHECIAAVGRPISSRTLRNWRNALLAPHPIRKRAVDVPSLEPSVLLPGSGETGTGATPDAPQIDLTGKSRIEALDLAIDARLRLLVNEVKATGDASLSKIVAELMDARRRELSIPASVMAALGRLGRLAALLERLRDAGGLP